MRPAQRIYTYVNTQNDRTHLGASNIMNCGNASMLDTEVLLDNPHCNIYLQKRVRKSFSFIILSS